MSKIVDNWYSLSRIEQLEYYEKHSYIPIPPPNSGYKTSMTGRYVKWLLILGWLTKETGIQYHHYDTINSKLKEVFGNSLTSYARLARMPWDLIDSENQNNYKPNQSGYFKLNKRGRDFLNLRIKVAKTVLFLENSYSIVGDEYIYANEASNYNFKETLQIMKTF